jgi:hypothetical protein
MSNIEIQGVKVFSATKSRDRDLLGETITDWIRCNSDKEILEKIVTQSSDSEFHCLTITLFYRFAAASEEKLPSTTTPKRLNFGSKG